MKYIHLFHRPFLLVVLVLLNASAFAGPSSTGSSGKAFNLQDLASQLGKEAGNQQPSSKQVESNTDSNSTNNPLDLSQFGNELEKKRVYVSGFTTLYHGFLKVQLETYREIF